MRLQAEQPSSAESLAVERAGQGPLTFVLLHGGCCDQGDWTFQRTDLAHDHTVLSCDLPGHGESTTSGEASVAGLADSVTRLRRSRATDQQILVGHSMGCWLALESYRQDPLGVRGIVLIECTRFPETAASRQALRAQIRSVGAKVVLRAVYPSMLGADVVPETLAKHLARVEKVSEHFIRDLILSAIDWDESRLIAVLESLEVPLGVLQSTLVEVDGRRATLERAEQHPFLRCVQQVAPTATIKLMSGVSHFPHLDEPQVVSDFLQSFADRVRA